MWIEHNDGIYIAEAVITKMHRENEGACHVYEGCRIPLLSNIVSQKVQMHKIHE